MKTGGTPQQRAIRHATPDELAPFAKADGSMGPKVTAVSGYVRSRGKPAWIGALSRIEETLAGEAGLVFRCSDGHQAIGTSSLMRCWRILSGLQAVSER